MPRLVTAAILVSCRVLRRVQTALAQTPDGQPSFEVATKPAPPPAAIKGSGDRVMVMLRLAAGPAATIQAGIPATTVISRC